MSELFVEVLTEEIPAWMIEPRLEVIRDRLETLTEEFAGSMDGITIEADATSRRLWMSIAGLRARQDDRDETVKGPPERIAWDDEGSPTKALDGFLRKNGVGLDDVERRDGYVWVEKKIAGRTASDFFAEELPPLIEKLRWPKMMKWDGGEWIRPVHSVIALVDGEVVDLKLFGIAAGSRTEGHRTRHEGEIEIAGLADYEQKLEEAKVVVRTDERLSSLQRSARDLAAEVGGEPVADESIWGQWKYLTEYPGLVRATFDEEYLELPHEVLVTVMRVHQKQLPVVRGGELTSSFLAIIDGDDDPEGFASSGNAFVTNARFADALFFYRHDLRTRMVDRIDSLGSLQFQERLGDYRAKTERMLAIGREIARASGSQIGDEKLELAVRISKVDLQTEIVKELTELQGVMGGVYAREEGIDGEVADAIYDHYRPQTLDDELPRNELGAIVSLADKIDTLAGFFLLDLEPTGSRDPFALRRAAQGIVRILFAGVVPISASRLVEIGVKAHSIEHQDREGVRERLIRFLGERVRTILEGPMGYAYDEVEATMAAGWADDLEDLVARTEALRGVRGQKDFLSILDSAKRIANITPEDFSGELDPDLLEEDAERRLAELGSAVDSQIEELIESQKYREAFSSFAAMAPELEQFFNDVLVNVEDTRVRDNRIALLQVVGNSVSAIADVTKVVVERKAIAG